MALTRRKQVATLLHTPESVVSPTTTARVKPVRVTHIITDLDTGGAEMMLYKVLSQMNEKRIQAEVISLQDIGTVGEKISRLGIKVRALGMDRYLPNPLAVMRLAGLLRQSAPDVVQTWMYHANLVGGVAAKIAGNLPVVWGIHHSNFDVRKTKRRTLLTMKAGALLSGRIPRKIICCGEVPRRVHIEMGYDAKKMAVIPNGFDLNAFQPNPLARVAVRKELGLPTDAPLIGLIARFHPKKDHHNFVRAAALLALTHPTVHFVLCGDGVTMENRELKTWLGEARIENRCHLLGIRSDIPRLTAALDIATSSSSYGEGFPISLGEAMACGVPCVATNVGDSGHIIGTTGVTVAPNDPFELSQAWTFLLQLDRPARAKLEISARQRIAENFNLPSIVNKYETVYEVMADAQTAVSGQLANSPQ